MIRGVLGSRTSVGGVLGSGRGGGGNGLLTGLVAYWGLDEASGNALDKHSGGLTLTQANSPGADTGKVYATVRTFNGSGQYFSRASETALQVGYGTFAFALWVYPASLSSIQDYVTKYAGDDVSDDYIVGYSNTAQRFRFIFRRQSDRAVVQIFADTFGIPSINQWHLIIADYNATTNTAGISINGGTIDTNSVQKHTQSGTAAFQIGGLTALSRYATARIGPVAFWKNRTLSTADRTALWNGGAGLAYSAFS